MRKFIVLLFIFLMDPRIVWAQSTTWAILQQTATQTAEHIRRLQEAIRTVQLIQSQVKDTEELLKLAAKASEGIDGLEFISDFRNVVIETNDLIKEIEYYINKSKPLSEEWLTLFGKIDDWVDKAGDIFKNIKMSDSVNSRSYSIADSYHEKYQENSQYALQLIENAKIVNEKGALKQIAEEVGHLIQMENQVIFLLSEMLRAQSVEYSNENLKRKEEIIRFEQENIGVRRFLDMASNDSFGI